MDRVMISVVGALVLMFGGSISQSTTPTPTADFWTRLNYGLSGIRRKTVCLSENFVSHIFHLELPRETRQTDDTFECDSRCNRLGKVPMAINALRKSVRDSLTELILEINELIPEQGKPRTTGRARTSRGLVDGVGDIQKWLWGTATEGDLKGIRSDLQTIRTLGALTAVEAERTRQGLAGYTKLTGDRLDALHSIAEVQNTQLRSVASSIDDIFTTSQLELNSISVLAQELALYTTLHETMQTLRDGLIDLIGGRMTPKLISHIEMAEAINSMTQSMRNRGVAGTLCYKTVNEAFAANNYEIARQGQDIIIKMYVPYTTLSKMAIYETLTIPMAVQGDQGLVTEVKNVPKYIIASMNTRWVGELRSLPQSNVVDVADIIFHRGLDNACIYFLFRDLPQAVQEYCEFTLYKRQIDSSLIKLTDEAYLVTNTSRVDISCQITPTVSDAVGSSQNKTLFNCNPCQILLGCGCTLSLAGEVGVARQRRHAFNDRTMSALHASNLIILQLFYDLTGANLTGKTLLEPGNVRQPHNLSINFLSDNTTQLLSRDSEVKYDLKKLAKGLENSSVVYHSASEGLLYDYIKTRSDYNGFWSFGDYGWLSYAVSLEFGCIGFLALYLYWVRGQGGNGMGIVTAIPMLPKTSAFQLKSTATPITTTTMRIDVMMAGWLKQVKDFEWLTIIMIIVLVIFATWVIWVVRKLSQRRDYVYFQFKRTGKAPFIVQYMSIPDANRCYSLLSKGQPKFILHDFKLFGILFFSSEPWKLMHNFSNHVTPGRTWIRVKRNQIAPLREILAGEHKVVPLIIHSHAYTYKPDEIALDGNAPPEYDDEANTYV